jgi:hypothetical protein
MTKAPAKKPIAKVAPDSAASGGGSIPTPFHTKPSFLSKVFEGLDEAYVEAASRVQELETALEVAHRDLAAMEALKVMRDGGGLPLIGGSGASAKPIRKASGGASGGGGRAPRGDVPKRVMELLGENPKGLPAGTIIARLNAEDKEKTSVRNFLATGKRNGTLAYDEAAKTYRLGPSS